MRLKKRMLATVLSMSLIVSGVSSVDMNAASKKVKLNKAKATITVGKTVKISVKNAKSKAKVSWKTSKKSVAKITKATKKGKAYAKVKGIKVGTATIKATYKIGKKKTTLKCKVIVKAPTTVPTQGTETTQPVDNSAAPATSVAPIASAAAEVSAAPATESKAPATESKDPVEETKAPVEETKAPVEETKAPVVESEAPAVESQTPATENPLDPTDPTYDVRWAELPVNESFESEDTVCDKYLKDGITSYEATGGKTGGYAKVKMSQWTGPTVFLDNRFSDKSTRFVVSAYIKTNNEEDKYKEVNFWEGNTFDGATESKYLQSKYGTICSRKLNTEWERIVKVISVPKNKFLEVRVVCPTAEYCIDDFEARLLAEGEVEPTMDAEVEEPAPEDAIANTFTLTGDQLTPVEGQGDGWVVNEDGSVTVDSGWKYYAIAFEKPVDLSKFGALQLKGSVNGGYRMSFRNKAGVFFIADPKTKDDWKYPSEFADEATIQFEGSGYADYLILGTKGSDNPAVTFSLESITMKETTGPINTDGITEANKEVGMNNPIAAQRFMADPFAIEYEGTVYVYGTNDSQQMQIGEDGTIPSNNYSEIKTLNCYSSKDMVNWTDEGIIEVAGKNGPASWAKNSWAPAVAHKKINGKDKFFIYFADNGSGIGVVESDSPTGPFVDPIGTQLISRNTPNCSGTEVPWLFDPAVFVDDDGQGYLYFGGIGEAKDREHPRCTRVVKLGDDMISLAGDPVEIDAPGAFEDSGINKIGDKYYYSYCTNWDARSDGLGTANIAYMVSDDPMGPFTDAKVVLKNPTQFFDMSAETKGNANNNNHHCILERNGKLYMFYHSQMTADMMGITQGYRTTGVNLIEVDAGGNMTCKMDMTGVEGDGYLDPFDTIEAETFAWSMGTSTVVGPEDEERNNRVLSSIDDGDYVGLDRVDFGEEGANSVDMTIASAEAEGTIDVYIDDMTEANKVGTVNVEATGAEDEFDVMTAELNKTVTGVHKVFFVYHVSGIYVDDLVFDLVEGEEE